MIAASRFGSASSIVAAASIAFFAAFTVRTGAPADPAVAAVPPQAKLNPLVAAEWWLRGQTTWIDDDGTTEASDGVDAIRAWSTSTGAGVVVAVVDSGVDIKESTLRGRLLPGRDFIAGGAVTGDPYGHGTQIATLIAGNPRQDAGILGVAPDARVLPLRVGTATGAVPDAAAAHALSFAVANPRVRVINVSWEKDYSRLLDHALRALAPKRSVLLVASAGNDGSELSESMFLPQRFDRPRVLLPQSLDRPNELVVASSNLVSRLSSFSNYGPDVHVAAPGERILSAFPGDTLKMVGGTSLAAPIVSGVAALLFSRYPQATAAQVKQAIVSSCTRTPALLGLVECHGIINAPRALQALAETLGGHSH